VAEDGTTGRVRSRTLRTASLQSVLQDEVCTQGPTLESRDSKVFGDTFCALRLPL